MDKGKLKAIVHYVTRAYSTTPELLGSVRLHKILWHSEVRNIRNTGYPIAGERFIKKPFGPCSQHLDEITQELRTDRKLTIVEPTEEYEARHYVAKGEPDKQLLTKDEWKLIDGTMKWIVETHTAGSVSERTHGDVWEATAMYAPMPIQAEVLQCVRPSERIEQEIREHAQHL